MRLSHLFVSALALLSPQAYAKSDSDVVVLTKDNFKTFTAAEKLALVEFYAPWCGHCKALEPKYEQAATQLLGKAKLAKVDCTVETDICNELGIKGFPTLKVYDNGKVSEYTGTREVDGIVHYMTKITEPRFRQLSGAQLKDLVKAQKIAVVGYLKDKESKEFKALEQLAEQMFMSTTFAYTFDAVDAKQAGVAVPSIVLHKSFDEPTTVFSGELSPEALRKFVVMESMPLMGEITPENYPEYVEVNAPIAYFFYENDEHKALGKKELEPLAKQFKGKFVFAYITSKFSQHGEMLGCKGAFPWFTVQEPKAMSKFPLHEKITGESVKKHLEGILDGSVVPFLKSEEVPSDNNGPVVTVVGKTFNEIVNDKSKDVFLELYAPWCGHCKKLAPIWKELGDKVKAQKNIVIAQFDGTANDLPAGAGFELRGFPTLVLSKANSNEILTYEGDRSLEDMIKFLKNNAVHGAELEVASAEPERDEL